MVPDSRWMTYGPIAAGGLLYVFALAAVYDMSRDDALSRVAEPQDAAPSLVEEEPEPTEGTPESRSSPPDPGRTGADGEDSGNQVAAEADVPGQNTQSAPISEQQEAAAPDAPSSPDAEAPVDGGESAQEADGTATDETSAVPGPDAPVVAEDSQEAPEQPPSDGIVTPADDTAGTQISAAEPPVEETAPVPPPTAPSTDDSEAQASAAPGASEVEDSATISTESPEVADSPPPASVPEPTEAQASAAPGAGEVEDSAATATESPDLADGTPPPSVPEPTEDQAASPAPASEPDVGAEPGSVTSPPGETEAPTAGMPGDEPTAPQAMAMDDAEAPPPAASEPAETEVPESDPGPRASSETAEPVGSPGSDSPANDALETPDSQPAPEGGPDRVELAATDHAMPAGTPEDQDSGAVSPEAAPSLQPADSAPAPEVVRPSTGESSEVERSATDPSPPASDAQSSASADVPANRRADTAIDSDATAQPDGDDVVAAVAIPDPVSPPPADAESSPADDVATYDVVQVAPDGRIVVAGRTEPGFVVDLLSDGTVIGTERANRSGEFVFVPDKPLLPGTRELSLAVRPSQDSDSRMTSRTVVAVIPDREISTVQASEPAAQPSPTEGPVALLIDEEGETVRLLVGEATEPDGALSLATVTFDEAGSPSITGRGAPGQQVTVYLDNEAVDSVMIGDDGYWNVRTERRLSETGTYKLRVDQSAPDDDAVTERIVATLVRAGGRLIPSSATVVTVERGMTLWGISRRHYGRGILYTLIYNANNYQIADPHWIYPGQKFLIPNQE